MGAKDERRLRDRGRASKRGNGDGHTDTESDPASCRAVGLAAM